MLCGIVSASTDGSPALMPAFTLISGGLPTSGEYSAIAMGDVDKDGKADLLSGATGLYFWKSTGSSWTLQTITTTGIYGGVALADVSGDGTLDALATIFDNGGGPSGLRYWTGSAGASGITWTAQTAPYSSCNCDDISIGDIEGDNDMDIALSTRGSGLKVLLNTGSGTSWTILTLGTTNYEDTGIALGDLNGDNRLDIVATNHPGNNANVFLCSASGTVAYSGPHFNGLNTGRAYGVAIAELTGDGDKDLAIGLSGGFTVYKGNGCSGTNSTWWTELSVPSPGSSASYQISTGDINGDGSTDIAVATDGGIGILENDGTGLFTKNTPSNIPTTGGWTGCRLGYWDTDGDLDIAICSWQGNGVKFLRNDLASVPEPSPAPLVMISVILIVAIVVRLRKK
jgi:hypothetical protein